MIENQECAPIRHQSIQSARVDAFFLLNNFLNTRKIYIPSSLMMKTKNILNKKGNFFLLFISFYRIIKLQFILIYLLKMSQCI